MLSWGKDQNAYLVHLKFGLVRMMNGQVTCGLTIQFCYMINREIASSFFSVHINWVIPIKYHQVPACNEIWKTVGISKV